MSFEFEAIRKEAQDSLINFLNVEMKLGTAMAQSAVLAHDQGNVEEQEKAKDSAIWAAETVERFKSHVVDAKVRNEIGERLRNLQKLISTL